MFSSINCFFFLFAICKKQGGYPGLFKQELRWPESQTWKYYMFIIYHICNVMYWYLSPGNIRSNSFGTHITEKPPWHLALFFGRAWDLCPKTTKFGSKLAFLVILGQAFPAYLVPCWWVGWWLWRAGCISQDTYLLYLYLWNIFY